MDENQDETHEPVSQESKPRPAVSPEMRKKAGEWLTQIRQRESEFEKGWWADADEAARLYAEGKETVSGNATADTPYNILYSNTEVLLPSLYSATPKPDIRSRFKGAQVKPIPEVIERFLTVAADPAQVGADCYDLAMQDCTLSTLTAGLGYVRLRYYEDRAFPLTYESGHYRTLIWGKCSRWPKTPWVAFVHKMHKESMFERFEIEHVDKVGFIPDENAPDNDKDACVVYEFWDKDSRKIYYLSENWEEVLLQEAEDPMKLEGFYPTPGPLLLTDRPGKFEPVTLYSFYKNQAEELNRVTVRLNKVLEAIKVRGGYSGMIQKDLESILAGDDKENALVPLGEASMMAQAGGLDKHIWMLPIDKFIIVAQQLYQARENIKNVIYEITGISDIIRGSSVASETATAQDLKNKWGTVRLRKMQTRVANYARDLFRLSVDCASTVIPPEKWKSITQLPIPLQAEKQAAQERLQQIQMQAQIPPIPGQPPAPPAQPDPQLLSAAQSPSWEEILAKIAEDMSRTFVVNIQTSSTIDLDTSSDKAEVSEFMTAMGQLLAGLQPLATLGPSGIEAAKAILISVLQRFKLGVDVADVVGKIQAQPPQGENNQAEKEKLEMEREVMQTEAAMKKEKLRMDAEFARQEHAFRMAELAAKMEETQIKLQAARLKAQMPAGNIRQSSPKGGQ